MGLMVSHNIVCKQRPRFYENVDIVRVNSPWYTRQELVDVFNEGKPLFVDVNIKTREKEKKVDHNYTQLLKLVGKYNVDWVGISNVERAEVYDKVRELLGNNVTRICAKIETEMGCWHADRIIHVFDGIMVDTEDLAFEMGWERATHEKDRIYDLCEKLGREHFRLVGTVFEHKGMP